MANVTAPVGLSLDGVAHRFGTRPVFAPVSLTVAVGQVGVVTGPNGAGKSTLLRIVAGLLTPTEGDTTVTVLGQNLDPIARRGLIGYVAPDLYLYRELTGVENLRFFGSLRGLALTNDDLRTVLSEVGLRGRGRELVGNYSSGMRQRLKYAFALLTRPPILLLDEPTANLDVDGVAMVERVIKAQQTRPGGGLTLIATNEPREVAWGDISARLQIPTPTTART